MKTIGSTLLIGLMALCFSGCLISERAKMLDVEVMKPGIIQIPRELDRVAIIKRDLYHSDTAVFRYYDYYRFHADSSVRFSTLSNKCTDALAEYLKGEGYFSEVRNFRDSLKQFLQNKDLPADEVFTQTKSNMIIFLDFFGLRNTFLNVPLNYMSTAPGLSWTIVFRGDSISYTYNQLDTLTFEGASLGLQNLERLGFSDLADDIPRFLGKSFGQKIIPSWIKVNRMYYRSNNQNMLRAEKYALNNQWLKAAEIWNRETRNENDKIAAKACFNMALAAEMEGKNDIAISWLVDSYSLLKRPDEAHRANCQRYIGVLAVRKKEIEKLGAQIR